MSPRIARLITPALLLLPLNALAQVDLSAQGKIESDIFTYAESPPAASLDNDSSTHFALQRVQDSEWRIHFVKPGIVQQISLIQGWNGWSLPSELEFESADGTTVRVAIKTDTRDPQLINLSLPSPTAFVDVRVTNAILSPKQESYGGIAELHFLGTLSADDTTPPLISNVKIAKHSDTSASVSWTTDEPSTSQVRFSCQSQVSGVSKPDQKLTTDHIVELSAPSALGGQIEIRSADAAGNRSELRDNGFSTMDQSFQFGVGGWSFQLDGKWGAASDLYRKDDLKVNTTQAWIGGSGWADWFKADGVKSMSEAGYTPEIIHYFFGDPVLADVQARREAFLDDIRALAKVLKDSGVGDKVIVTLEPEYNQNEIARWDGWNDLMIEAIQILHSQAGSKVGLLPGDWDIEHLTPISMGRAAAYADFVAFQEMRASTQDTPEEAKKIVSNAIRFTHFLSRRFLRPVRLGYLMVSDYGGWEGVQRDVVIEACERQDELKAAGLTAISWMSYLDNKASGGYFKEAESYKGLKHADASPKPAWHVWKECVANGPSWLKTGQEPPGAIAESSEGCSCRTGASTGSSYSIGMIVALGVLLVFRSRRIN